MSLCVYMCLFVSLYLLCIRNYNFEEEVLLIIIKVIRIKYYFIILLQY